MSTGRPNPLLPAERSRRCRPVLFAVLLLILPWLCPPLSSGQEVRGGDFQPSGEFVRRGDRLFRTASQYDSLIPDDDAGDASDPAIEESPQTAIVDDGGEFAVGPSPVVPPSGGLFCRNLRGLWVRPDFLLWWITGYDVPPLITSSPAGTGLDLAGELGQPATDVLFGNRNLDGGVDPGGRIRLGYWLDPCGTRGVEAAFFALTEKSSTFSAASPEVPILARPIFNVQPGSIGQDAEMVAFPELWDGSIQADSQTQLQGVDVLYRQVLCQDATRRVDWSAGYRYLGLDERLAISDFKRFVGTGTGLQVGTTIEEFDRFATQNDFHGGELGLTAELRRRRWTLEVLGKLAVGNNRSQVTINGSTTVTVPDPDVATTPYGLLALPSNSGTYVRDVGTVIPELGITLGYQLTGGLRATVGYTLLYWSQVARPGDQIDLDVNLSQIQPGGLAGPARPEFIWTSTDVWAQGLSLGLDYRF